MYANVVHMKGTCGHHCSGKPDVVTIAVTNQIHISIRAATCDNTIYSSETTTTKGHQCYYLVPRYTLFT